MPIYVNLLQGQTSFWGLLLLSLFVTDLLNRREGRSGFWIGLLSFKPQLVAIPLLVLAIRCHWRALVTALTVMVSLGFMSFLLIGWEGVLEYQALLDGMASGTHLVISFSSMQNLRALFRFLGWSDSIWLVSALVLVLFYWWRSHGLEARDTWTSAVFLILLVSPHLYLHDLSLVVLVLALYLSTSRSELLSRYLVFGLFVLALLPLLTLFGWAMTGMKLPVLPVTLLLLFLALVYARSQGRLLTG
jgi:hypothetical protein